MRRSFVFIFMMVLCALNTAQVGLGAPTVLPGPIAGSVEGISDLEVRSDLYNVTFQWNWPQAVWGLPITGATFYGDPEGAELAGSAIDEALNNSFATSLYDPISGANGSAYNIAYDQSSGWIVNDSHYFDGTWKLGHQGWGIGFRSYRIWAVFTWTGEAPPSAPPPPPPNGTIPAPGALLLGSIGASFVSWLRRRRTL